MRDAPYRPPTDEEHEPIEAAYNDYYSFGDRFDLAEFPVVVDAYETGDGAYTGRLAIVVDGAAVLLSDALNERPGEDPF